MFRELLKQQPRSLQASFAVGVRQLLSSSLLKALETQVFVNDTGHQRPMDVRRMRDFTDRFMALRLVFLAQHQFVNEINVISCAGDASSAAAWTTVDRPSNPRSFCNNL